MPFNISAPQKVGVLLAFLFLFAATIVAAQSVRCDRFQPKATLNGTQLTISLDTDLPDTTTIMVSVSRSYWAGSPLKSYPLNFLDESSTVGQWRKPRVVNVDDASFRRMLNERLQIVARAGLGQLVTRTDNHAAVKFVVPINQADSRFGDGNRNLVGTKVATSMGLRVVLGSVTVPLAPTPKLKAAEFGSPDDLHVGVTYRLSKQTPISPERYPSDPAAAVALIRQLPSGTTITVVSVDRGDPSNPWYRVTSVDKNGWMNSIALIGQELLVVKR